MSPELFVQDSVSPALDIYSLGVVSEWPAGPRSPLSSARPARPRSPIPHAALHLSFLPLTHRYACVHHAVYLMWAGKDPYANKTTAMIILSKVRRLAVWRPLPCVLPFVAAPPGSHRACNGGGAGPVCGACACRGQMPLLEGSSTATNSCGGCRPVAGEGGLAAAGPGGLPPRVPAAGG